MFSAGSLTQEVLESSAQLLSLSAASSRISRCPYGKSGSKSQAHFSEFPSCPEFWFYIASWCFGQMLFIFCTAFLAVLYVQWVQISWSTISESGRWWREFSTQRFQGHQKEKYTCNEKEKSRPVIRSITGFLGHTHTKLTHIFLKINRLSSAPDPSYGYPIWPWGLVPKPATSFIKAFPSYLLHLLTQPKETFFPLFSHRSLYLLGHFSISTTCWLTTEIHN